MVRPLVFKVKHTLEKKTVYFFNGEHPWEPTLVKAVCEKNVNALKSALNKGTYTLEALGLDKVIDADTWTLRPRHERISHMAEPMIFPDDSVSMVHSKLASVWGPLYVWGRQDIPSLVRVREAFVKWFLVTLFSSSKLVSLHELRTSFQFMTSQDISIVLRLEEGEREESRALCLEECLARIDVTQHIQKLLWLNIPFGTHYTVDGMAMPWPIDPSTLQVGGSIIKRTLRTLVSTATSHSNGSMLFESMDIDTLMVMPQEEVRDLLKDLDNSTTIQAHVYGHRGVHLMDAELVRQVDLVLQEYHESKHKGSGSVKWALSHAVLQHTGHNIVHQDLYRLFKQLFTTQDMPLIRVVCPEGAFVKLHSSLVGDASWTEWLKEMNATQATADPDANALIVMFRMEHQHVLFVLDDALGFRILASSKTGLVLDMPPHFQTLLKFIHAQTRDPLFPSSLPPAFVLLNERTRGIQVRSLVYKGVFQPGNSLESLDHIADLAAKLSPVVDVGPYNKKTKLLSLVFKRVDHYLNLSPVQVFLLAAMKTLPDKAAMAQALVTEFGINKPEAVAHVTRFFDEIDHIRIMQQLSGSKGILIRLKATNQGYRVVLKGVLSQEQLDRCEQLLRFLASYAKPVKQKEFRAIGNHKINIAPPPVVVPNSNDNSPSGSPISAASSFNPDDWDIDEEDMKFLQEMDEEEAGPIAVDKGSPTGSNSGENVGKGNRQIMATLNQLDRRLFDFKVDKKGPYKKKYSSVCQAVDSRQPIAISAQEKAAFDAAKARAEPFGDYGTGVFYGSDRDKKESNYYTCPAVWCPLSRTPLSFEQFVKLNMVCPNPHEKPEMLYDAGYWYEKPAEKAPKVKAKRLNPETGALQPVEIPVPKARHIGFVANKYHPEGFCLPCCFSKLEYRTKECAASLEARLGKRADHNKPALNNDDVIGNIKYIKSDAIPVDNGRFGLLPKSLNNVFRNSLSKLGSRPDGTGLMHDKTDGYLRKGLELAQQPYLNCVSHFLNIKTDLAPIIVKHMTPMLFLSLSQGRVAKYFMSQARNHMDDLLMSPNAFARLKTEWFDKHERTYVRHFNLGELVTHARMMSVWDRQDSYAKELAREMILFQAYQEFLAYCKDIHLPKDPSILGDLFNRPLPWLNSMGILIVVMTMDAQGNVLVPCPLQGLDPYVSAKRVGFMVHQGRHYEPILHVHINPSNNFMEESWTHPVTRGGAVDRILSTLKADCPTSRLSLYPDVYRVLVSSNIAIKHHVITYDFQLAGVILNDDCYVAFPSPEPFDIQLGRSYIYVSDVRHVLRKAKLKLNEADVTALLARLDAATQGAFQITGKVARQVTKDDPATLNIIALEMSNNRVTPLTYVNLDRLLQTYTHDLEMATGLENPNTRVMTMNIAEKQENMVHVLSEEVDRVLQQNPSLIRDVYTLRHPESPYSRSAARDILMRRLAPYIKPLTLIRPDSAPGGQKGMRKGIAACSAQLTVDTCEASPMCQWTTRGCKVRLSQEAFDRALNKIAHLLLLPTTHLGLGLQWSEAEPTTRPTQEVVVTDGDIASGRVYALLEGIQQSLFSAIQHKHVTLESNHPPVAMASAKIPFPGPLELGPLSLKLSKKQFQGYQMVQRQPAYQADDLFVLFASISQVTRPHAPYTEKVLRQVVYDHVRLCLGQENAVCIRRIVKNRQVTDRPNQKLTGEDILKKIGPKMNSGTYMISDYEIEILCNLVNIKTVILGRAGGEDSDGKGDGVRVLGLLTDSPYLVMLYKVRTRGKDAHDQFYLVVRARQQNHEFLFTLGQFDDSQRQVLYDKIQYVYR